MTTTTTKPQTAFGRLLATPGIDWIMLGALVVIWGSAFAALKLAATGGMDALWLVVFRVVTAAIVLGVLVGVSRPAPVPRLRPLDPRWGWAFVVGVPGMALPFVGFAWAAHHVDSAVLSILNGAAPLFTALLAHQVIASERLTWPKVLGVGLGFSGLVVLLLPKLSGGVDASLLACLAGIAATAGYALGNVVTKLAPPVHPAVMALLLCLCASAVCVPVALLFEPFPTDATPAAWFGVLYLGVGPTALATVVYVWLIQRKGPLFVAMVTYMTPVFATAIGIGLLGERPGWHVFAALGLVLAGVAAANLKRKAA
jgi:drug/metabolite transporter (DMT)-like permease